MKLSPQAEFWKDPNSTPEGIDPPPKPFRQMANPMYWSELADLSHYLVAQVEQYVKPPASILEPGAGSGRNLSYFKNAGFAATGIEINPDAAAIAWDRFRIDHNDLLIGSVEEKLPWLSANAIITQGFLMHLPEVESSYKVFDSIALNAMDLILTNEIEDRPFLDDYRIMRNYREIFEPRGWTQVSVRLPRPGSNPTDHSFTRIFLRDGDERTSE